MRKMHYLKIICPTVTLLTRLFARNYMLSKLWLDHLSLIVFIFYVNAMQYRAAASEFNTQPCREGVHLMEQKGKEGSPVCCEKHVDEACRVWWSLKVHTDGKWSHLQIKGLWSQYPIVGVHNFAWIDCFSVWSCKWKKMLVTDLLQCFIR